MFGLFKAKEIEDAAPERAMHFTHPQIFVLNHQDREDSRTLELSLDVELCLKYHGAEQVAFVYLMSVETH